MAWAGPMAWTGPPPLVAAEEQVVPPGLVAFVGEIRREQRVQVAARLERCPEQADARLLRRLAALAVVARLARSHEVVPGVGPTAVPRADVVKRQVVGDSPAVQCAVSVTGAIGYLFSGFGDIAALPAAGLVGSVHVPILVFVGLSAMAASGLGVKFAQAISTRTLKIGFEIFLLALALKLFFG